MKIRLLLTAFVVSVSAALAMPLGAAGDDTRTSDYGIAGSGGLFPFLGGPAGSYDEDDGHMDRDRDWGEDRADDRGDNRVDQDESADEDEDEAEDEATNEGAGERALQAPDAPTVGGHLNVGLDGGSIRIKLPGSSGFVALAEDASIPFGSVVDARSGIVTLTSAHDNGGTTQSAAFTGSAFKITQKAAARPVTKLRLRGGGLRSCPTATKAGVATIAASRRRPRRSLWGSGHGRFRTIGRHGAATVRGTIWRTTDTCAGTLVKVRRGRVKVRDFPAHKTVVVTAGHRHFARAVAPGR